MKHYQSFGAGVNSVALAEILDNRVEKVMSDPRCEMPETYQYLKNYPHKLKILKPVVEGCESIEKWCHKLGHAPFRMYRSCTYKWKINPLHKYFKKPCIVYLGIAYDEKHRARKEKQGRIKFKYPLIENGITREKCFEIIKESGIKIPPKSGCWLCPFQSKHNWWSLGRNHPSLFWRAVKIDELSDKVKCWDKGLRNLWPPQLTLIKEENENWECSFCLI